jgi:chromosomal replication initiator protein
MEDSQVVVALSAQLAERVGAKSFNLWFKSQAELCVEAGCLTIRVASEFVRDWLRRNFEADIRACWQAIVGEPAKMEFAVDAALAPRDKRSRTCSANPPAEPHSPQLEKLPVSPAHLDPQQKAARLQESSESRLGTRSAPSLARFVVGASNEYAYHAADLTARGRQQASPLVFCGTVGVGKTHLLRAIQQEYRRHHPRAAAIYMTAEQFTTGFVEACRGSGLPSFRHKCRGVRLLAIDDLQFFAGKQRTLEELLHTFDAMAADGRRLVLASDRSLAELRSIGMELVSRLSGGLICEIEPPEFTTRLGILRQLRDDAGLAMEDSVLEIIATQITAGGRELQGALNQLEAISAAYEEPISREMAERMLADLARHSTRAVRLADVQKAVCDVFGVEPAQLRSDRKGRSVSEPRMIAMWLARKYTKAAWSEIGQYFGRRSHSTVISAHRRVEKLIASQAQIGIADQTCRVEDAIRRLESALRTA